MQEAYLGLGWDSPVKSPDPDQQESQNCLPACARVYKSVGTHSMLHPITYISLTTQCFPILIETQTLYFLSLAINFHSNKPI